MATLVGNHKGIAVRQREFRENMIKHGFKRVQKWVFNLENYSIQEKMRKEAIALKYTEEMHEWDRFTEEQLENVEGWK
jgi:hypothetical protein